MSKHIPSASEDIATARAAVRALHEARPDSCPGKLAGHATAHLDMASTTIAAAARLIREARLDLDRGHGMECGVNLELALSYLLPEPLPGAPEVTPEWLAQASREELNSAMASYQDGVDQHPKAAGGDMCQRAVDNIKAELTRRKEAP